jgi:trehalose/maltose hydrolase-like predicted phosphorylase
MSRRSEGHTGIGITGAACLCLFASGYCSSAFCEDDASFKLTATAADFANYFPGYLANGYLSTLTAPRGTEGNLAYMVAFMDYARDDISRPAAVPGWTEIDYRAGKPGGRESWLNKTALDANRFEDYRQTLDLRDATLTTSYRFVDGTKRTKIVVTTFVSQAAQHVAVSQLAITPDFDDTVQLSFAFNLWAPHQPRFPLGTLSGDEMEEMVAANNLPLKAIAPATPDRAALWYHGDTHILAADGNANDLTLWLNGNAERGLAMAQAAAIDLPAGLKPQEVNVYKSPFRLGLNLSVAVQRGKTYVFTKFIATSRDGWGSDASEDVKLAKLARTSGFDKLLSDHRRAWHTLWKSDIAIEGDARAQQVVHSDLYYLLSTSAVDAAWPMGACALTPGYAGHAFWDSDSWIFPALLLLHPQRAKSLVMFRHRTLGPAQTRAQQRGYSGAMYPWESDPENGTEQTPHFAYVLGEREIHVNADIAIAQWQYYLATQDRDWLRLYGWPVIRNVAEFWGSRATYNRDKRRYDILHVTSVDEDYNDVPNDTFTNASVRKALRIAMAAAAVVGEAPDPHWTDILEHLYIPFSAAEQHHIDFDETVPHNMDSWAGSALPMLSYPSLDLPMTNQVRRNNYAYAMRPIMESRRDPNSMGLAPISIAAATIGDATAATAWFERNFSRGTLKPPFNVRTETPHNNAGYFATASGGFVQNLVYGFSGLRIDETGLTDAYPPLLPVKWQSMTLRNIAFRGHHYDIIIDRDAGGEPRITRRPAAN